MTSLPFEDSPTTPPAIEFGEFYRVYPRKVKPIKARAAYNKARKIARHDEIMEGLRRYIATKPAYADWAHPSTWLNDGRWMDEPDTIPALKAGISKGAFRGESLETIAQIVIKYGSSWARCRYPRDVLELLVHKKMITVEQKDAAL